MQPVTAHSVSKINFYYLLNAYAPAFLNRNAYDTIFEIFIFM